MSRRGFHQLLTRYLKGTCTPYERELVELFASPIYAVAGQLKEFAFGLAGGLIAVLLIGLGCKIIRRETEPDGL